MPALRKGNRYMILYLAGYKPCDGRWNLDTSDIYILSSFWEHKSGKYGAYVRQEKHILDSGAFSSFSGKLNNIDWDVYVKKYADFIITNKIQKFFELDIDCVVGLQKVEDMRKYLEDRTGLQPIPVWHSGRGKEYFYYMCETFPYVGIGTTSANEQGRRIRNNPMVLKWFIDTAHENGCKIHGLGFTDTTYLKFLKFDSIDSTTWLAGARYGQIYEYINGQMIYHKPPEGMRAVNHDKVNKHNFNEWIKFQKYAEKYL